MNNNTNPQVIYTQQKPFFKQPVWIITGLMLLAALAGLGTWKLYQPAGPKPGQPPALPQPTPIPQTISGPQVTRFAAFVKEVKNNQLVAETGGNPPETLEIPLDQNTSLEIWVSKDGKDKPPTLQNASSADLKVNQRVGIFKSEVSGQLPFYEITIYND